MTYGYPVVSLGDLCDVLDSKRRPITKRDRVEGEFPYYGATGILGYVDGYIFDEPLVLIGEDGAKWGSGENTAFSASGRYWVNNHAHVVRPHRDRLLDSWLIYQLNQADLSPFITGLTVPKLNQAKMREIPIVLPPLEEQRRIVAVLDQAFIAIATATANAQKNLTNARALFERYLESVFSKKETDWREVSLGNACKVERGSSPRPIKSFITTANDGVNWIKIGDTKDDSKYINQTQQRITPAGALRSRRVDPGDFILTNSMSFGKPYIMKISGYIHDGWFALRLGKDIDTEYFYYLLSSPVVQNQFNALAAGAIVLNISGDLVKKAILPIPPIEKQLKLVSGIQAFDREVKRLADIYESKLAALTELKQSLLQRAFAGELT